MSFQSGDIVFGEDVADRFWNSYLSGQVSSGQSYVNGVLYGGGTTNFSNANVVHYSIYYWFQNDSSFPGSQSHPGSASAPTRALNDLYGDITAAGIFNAIKTETQRFTSYNANVKWYVTRNWQTYTVPAVGGGWAVYGPEGRPYNGSPVATVLYQRAHEQVKARWMTTSQFTFTDPANNIAANVDDVSTTEYNTLFQGFKDAYVSAKGSATSVTVYSSYTQCHNSCHYSCHGSRTRR